MLVERGKAIYGISTAPVWPPNENSNMKLCCRKKAAEIKTLKMVINFHQADKWLMENEVHEKMHEITQIKQATASAWLSYDRASADLKKAENRADRWRFVALMGLGMLVFPALFNFVRVLIRSHWNF